MGKKWGWGVNVERGVISNFENVSNEGWLDNLFQKYEQYDLFPLKLISLIFIIIIC